MKRDQEDQVDQEDQGDQGDQEDQVDQVAAQKRTQAVDFLGLAAALSAFAFFSASAIIFRSI